MINTFKLIDYNNNGYINNDQILEFLKKEG
jgi:Ca2+-binding EF-hand superfamily protein